MLTFFDMQNHFRIQQENGKLNTKLLPKAIEKKNPGGVFGKNISKNKSILNL